MKPIRKQPSTQPRVIMIQSLKIPANLALNKRAIIEGPTVLPKIQPAVSHKIMPSSTKASYANLYFKSPQKQHETNSPGLKKSSKNTTLSLLQNYNTASCKTIVQNHSNSRNIQNNYMSFDTINGVMPKFSHNINIDVPNITATYSSVRNPNTIKLTPLSNTLVTPKKNLTIIRSSSKLDHQPSSMPYVTDGKMNQLINLELASRCTHKIKLIRDLTRKTPDTEDDTKTARFSQAESADSVIKKTPQKGVVQNGFKHRLIKVRKSSQTEKAEEKTEEKMDCDLTFGRKEIEDAMNSNVEI